MSGRRRGDVAWHTARLDDLASLCPQQDPPPLVVELQLLTSLLLLLIGVAATQARCAEVELAMLTSAESTDPRCNRHRRNEDKAALQPTVWS